MRIKIVIVLLVTILINLQGSVNAVNLAEIEVGAGPNYGYLDYDDPLEIWDAGWAMGFAGGISFEIPLANQLYILPGARFTYLKNNVQIKDPDIYGEYEVKHKMISVPVLFRYELKRNMLFIDMGPELSLFMSSELNADYTELGTPRKKTDDISDSVDNYDIGACVKIGFKACRWNIPIAVTAAYHHGFTGVAVDDEWLSDWKTREISISVSYLFDLTK